MNNTFDDNSAVFEGMTSISAVIRSVRSASTLPNFTYDRQIHTVLFDRAKLNSKSREYKFLTYASEDIGFELKVCGADEIDHFASGNTHGGIIALCSDRTMPQLTVENITESGFYALIEGIEDPYNFGYSIRSLYAAGVDGIILTPRNWMSAAGTVAKASAGTSELLPMYCTESACVGELFHAKNYKIAAAGIRDSVSFAKADLKKPLLLIVGGEKRGISRSLLECVDTTVRIDYAREFKGSLPTASAVSVLAFEVLRQNQ